jgi:hypothetical protein
VWYGEVVLVARCTGRLRATVAGRANSGERLDVRGGERRALLLL